MAVVASLLEWRRLENMTGMLPSSTEEEFVLLPRRYFRPFNKSDNALYSSSVTLKGIDELLLFLGPVPLPKRLMAVVLVKLRGIAGVLLLFPVPVPLPKRPPSCPNGLGSDVLVD